MRKIIIVILVLCLASPVSAKILGLVGSGSLCWADVVTYRWHVMERACEVLGVDVEYLSASDSTAVWNAMNSGDYSKAVMVNLPITGTEYDTQAECDALGLGELTHWMDRSDALACPIPLIIPSGTSMSISNGFTGTVTGAVGGYTDPGGSTGQCIPIVNADGDSIYTHTHNSGRTYQRVATSDSLSWVHPVLWSDSTTTLLGDVNQKISVLWYTEGSGNHKVYYIPYAAHSYAEPIYMSVLAIGEDVCAVEEPILIGSLGYSTSYGDSTRLFEERFTEFVDSLESFGAKATFLIETEDWCKTNLSTYGRDKFPTIEGIVAGSDNAKFIHNTKNAWDGNYWFGYTVTITQSDVEGHISSSVDSTDANMGSGVVPSNTVYPFGGYYSGYYAQNDWSAVFGALAEQGISNVYVRGNSDKDFPPIYDRVGIGMAQRYWIYKTDNTYHELNMLGYARNWDSATYLGSASGGQVTTANANVGLFNSHRLRNSIGMVYNAQPVSIAIDKGFYQPGAEYPIGYLCGNGCAADPTINNMMLVLIGIENEKNMYNDIAGQEIIKYSWMEDVKYDRKLKRKYCNSHVKRD